MKRRIQDWITLFLGIWLFVSPWVFGYAGAGYAWNSRIFGIVVTYFSGFALNDRKVWEEWVKLVIGFWIFINPWIFEMITASIKWNHWIVGFLIVMMSVSSIMKYKRQTAYQ